MINEDIIRERLREIGFPLPEDPVTVSPVVIERLRYFLSGAVTLVVRHDAPRSTVHTVGRNIAGQIVASIHVPFDPVWVKKDSNVQNNEL